MCDSEVKFIKESGVARCGKLQDSISCEVLLFSTSSQPVYVCVCVVRPMHVQLHEGQHMCAVCNDVANGIHFGALTCEGCKVLHCNITVAAVC